MEKPLCSTELFLLFLSQSGIEGGWEVLALFSLFWMESRLFSMLGELGWKTKAPLLHEWTCVLCLCWGYLGSWHVPAVSLPLCCPAWVLLLREAPLWARDKWGLSTWGSSCYLVKQKHPKVICILLSECFSVSCLPTHLYFLFFFFFNCILKLGLRLLGIVLKSFPLAACCIIFPFNMDFSLWSIAPSPITS